MPAVPAASPFAAAYAPTVEWHSREWNDALTRARDAPYPVLATTLKTALARTKVPVPLRARLGGFTGQLVISGLARPKTLEAAHARRHHLFEYFASSRVDILCSPGPVRARTDSPAKAAADLERAFEFYTDAAAVLPRVAFTLPGGPQPPSALKRCWEFISEAGVKHVAIGAQQHRRGVLDATILNLAKTGNATMPPDVAVLVFGVGSQRRVAVLNQLLRGRPVLYSNTIPAARANFFQMLPGKRPAPTGMTKAAVYAHNTILMAGAVDYVINLPPPRRPPQPVTQRR
jgi:hypothetical protein